jgi:hypothetical protein
VEGKISLKKLMIFVLMKDTSGIFCKSKIKKPPKAGGS